MIEIKQITEASKADCIYHNDPFPLWGKMIPRYNGESWDYAIQEWPEEERSEMCFPDENYSFDEMSADTIFLGAYDHGQCIGLALLQNGFCKYMYLADLEVKTEYRRRGVGRMLIQEAARIALQNHRRGIYLQAQDNNLSACLFYLKNGFRVGGFNTEVYKGTSQEGKSDITFYLDAADCL